MVWNVYLSESLKGITRQKRGKGVRRRVSPSTTIPKSWKDFFRVDDNKTELFKFLAQHVTCLTVDEGKVLYATSAQNVQARHARQNLAISPHAHRRRLIHVSYCMRQMQWYRAKEGYLFAQWKRMSWY